MTESTLGFQQIIMQIRVIKVIHRRQQCTPLHFNISNEGIIECMKVSLCPALPIRYYLTDLTILAITLWTRIRICLFESRLGHRNHCQN